ncbi:glycosyl hydrolase family 28-related protein [Roseivirga sp. BDSF3-8]|uniref:glycosyl hydrolase family 28-related protein n=1 Tax=Roseivirga sp. BDSF3-8 TaxID=3241598 RepID=UPI003531E5EC
MKRLYSLFLRCGLLALAVLILPAAGSLAVAQAPVDNPVAARYDLQDHWTDEISWQQVVVANEVEGLVGEGSVVDSAIMRQAMLDISADGGGVLYFPAGTYHFTSDLSIPTGVVLRGESPATETEAKGVIYMLNTLFDFPKYKPTMSRQEMDTVVFVDIPNSTAFKLITADEGAEKIGLVNLDINRGMIDFHNRGVMADTSAQDYQTGTTSLYDKVVIYGNNQTNVAMPDPRIPSVNMRHIGQLWQRWPLHEASNINIMVKKYAIVANNRLNDKVEDTFRQFGYLADNGMNFDGARATFDYGDHNGITVIQNPDADDNASASVENTGSAPAGEVMVKDNYVRVLSQNEPIVYKGDVEVADNRTMLYDKEHESYIMRDGRSTLYNDYLRLFPNPEISTPHEFYTETDTVRYRLIKPLNYDPAKEYPMVVYLHGSGENGDDNKLQLRNFIWQFTTDEAREEYPCFIFVPQCPWHMQTFTESVEEVSFDYVDEVFMALDEVNTTYSIDKKRQYLVGISTGGWSTWEIIANYPKRFAAAVPIASYKRYNEWDKKERKKELRNARKTAVWAFHGEIDEWVPSAFARLSIAELRASGGKPKYTEFKGIGHLCWDELQHMEEFMPWLFAQRK